MVKRILDRMSSPSESSTKRCAYPHRSSEDYLPSSCFRSPEPSRRAQLVEHFDVPITLLVELPERICREVSFTEAEFDWLQSFPGKLVPLASTSHVHRYIAILKYAADMQYILTDLPESPNERQPEDAQVLFQS
jgi:hypothetical protein